MLISVHSFFSLVRFVPVDFGSDLRAQLTVLRFGAFNARCGIVVALTVFLLLQYAST